MKFVLQILNGITYNFGFVGFNDFMGSLLRSDNILLKASIAGALSLSAHFFEAYMGLKMASMMAFSALISLELITGVMASQNRGVKLNSRRFSRFGLKILVWLILFMVLNAFKNQYRESSSLVSATYEWLHIFVVGYVNMEYIISILENMGSITGKNYGKLIGIFKSKLGGIDDPSIQNLEEYLMKSDENLHIVDGNGIIMWANESELRSLGYTLDEYAGKSITDFHRDAAVIEDILTKLLTGDVLTNYSAYLKAKDGSIKRVLINSSGHWKDGKFVHTRCFSRDITNLPIPAGTGYIHSE